MTDQLMSAALQSIEANTKRFEQSFRAGDMVAAANDFYTPDAYYLTGKLTLLSGRAAITAFFWEINARIEAVYVEPYKSFGTAAGNGVIYQLCNTVQHLAGGGRGYGHYVAAFRRYGSGWLCEMETPAMGWIGGGEPGRLS